MAIFSRLNKYSDFGLLVLRIGLGTMMVLHGYPKLIKGPETWIKLGKAMENFGVSFYPLGWGLAATLTELLGGILMVIGLGFRLACLLLLFVMIVATTAQLSRGETISSTTHTIELASVFFGLLFVGPGRFSLDKS